MARQFQQFYKLKVRYLLIQKNKFIYGVAEKVLN